MDRNTLFFRFVEGIGLLLLLYGAGMFAVIIWGGDQTLAAKMINAFTAMFSGALGLGSGYLLGSAQQEPPREPERRYYSQQLPPGFQADPTPRRKDHDEWQSHT